MGERGLRFGRLRSSFVSLSRQFSRRYCAPEVSGQQEAFRSHYETVREHLQVEKRARERHETTIQDHLVQALPQ